MQDGFLRSEGVEEQDILPLGIDEPQMESQSQPHDNFSPSFDNAEIEEENNEGSSRREKIVEYAPTLASQNPLVIDKQLNICNKELSTKNRLVEMANENSKRHGSNTANKPQISRNNALNTTYPFDSSRHSKIQHQPNSSLHEISPGSPKEANPSDRLPNDNQKDYNARTLPRITIAQLGGLSSKNPSINISSDETEELSSTRSPISVPQLSANIPSEDGRKDLTLSTSTRHHATERNSDTSKSNEKQNETTSILQNDAKRYQQFKAPSKSRISTSTPKLINKSSLPTTHSQKAGSSIEMNQAQERNNFTEKAINVTNETFDQQGNDISDQMDESFEDIASNEQESTAKNNASFESNTSGPKDRDDASANSKGHPKGNVDDNQILSPNDINNERYVGDSEEKKDKRNNVSGGEEIKVALNSVNEGQSFKFSIPGTSRSVTLNFSANTLARMRNSVTMDGRSRENNGVQRQSDDITVSSEPNQDNSMEEVSSSTNIDEFPSINNEDEEVQNASVEGPNENTEEENAESVSERLVVGDVEALGENESDCLNNSSSLLRSSKRVERVNKKHRKKKDLLKRGSNLDIDKNKGGYQCQLCSKQYPSKRLLEKHVVFHVDQNTACSLCGKLFLKRWMLEQHLAIDHKQEEQTSTSGMISCFKNDTCTLLLFYVY